ncbi:unnamed protein product [Ceratitis capitata]|uniref:(Mediterranean fruit fly) hypothetical protein n=1 Tax=Ceratitis capitata TaxID=7213 RepID=A0A811U4S8_CERCA|nr:unnamed protein product [Ceratitis capitata]
MRVFFGLLKNTEPSKVYDNQCLSSERYNENSIRGQGKFAVPSFEGMPSESTGAECKPSASLTQDSSVVNNQRLVKSGKDGSAQKVEVGKTAAALQLQLTEASSNLLHMQLISKLKYAVALKSNLFLTPATHLQNWRTSVVLAADALICNLHYYYCRYLESSYFAHILAPTPNLMSLSSSFGMWHAYCQQHTDFLLVLVHVLCVSNDDFASPYDTGIPPTNLVYKGQLQQTTYAQTQRFIAAYVNKSEIEAVIPSSLNAT